MALAHTPSYADSGANEQSAMIALYPDRHVAERLAIENGNLTESLHVTLAHLYEGASPAATVVAREVAAKYGPLHGSFTGLGQFAPGDDGVPVITHVSAPRLDLMRSELVQRLKVAGVGVSENFGFVPHLTLRYAKPGEPLPDHALLRHSIPARFDALHVVSGDRRLDRIPLSGER